MGVAGTRLRDKRGAKGKRASGREGGREEGLEGLTGIQSWIWVRRARFEIELKVISQDMGQGSVSECMASDAGRGSGGSMSGKGARCGLRGGVGPGKEAGP